jgi:hypothetical protein
MTVEEVEVDATANPVLVGAAIDREPLRVPLPPREGPGKTCFAAPRREGGR